MKVKIVGETKLIVDLEKTIKNIGKLYEVVDKNTGEMQIKAKNYAPVDTGLLKRSITKEVRENVGIVESTVDYAVYQEYGTRYQPGTAHIRPALNAQKDTFIKDLEKLIK